MKIEILGTGCARCQQLYDHAVAASARLAKNAPIEVVKISDVHYFAKMGVFMTPGLVIDGELIATGKLLSPEEIQTKIEERL
jgi:small redox-active disulfide protein 2